MNKKLTLNIDDNLIEFAHHYSKKNKQSISSLVESYLLSLKKRNEISELSPKTQELYGILSNDPLPDKKEMRKRLYEKSID
jgi:hypothetical protein